MRILIIGCDAEVLFLLKLSKEETAGVARQQLHFLCVDERKRKQKKATLKRLLAMRRVPSRRGINPAKARTQLSLRQLALGLWINSPLLGSTDGVRVKNSCFLLPV